jgi:hypothetical protein
MHESYNAAKAAVLIARTILVEKRITGRVSPLEYNSEYVIARVT